MGFIYSGLRLWALALLDVDWIKLFIEGCDDVTAINQQYSNRCWLSHRLVVYVLAVSHVIVEGESV